MAKTMNIVGITTECRNTSMGDALRKSGYKVRSKKVSWPRIKGPRAVRLEVATGRAVAFVR